MFFFLKFSFSFSFFGKKTSKENNPNKNEIAPAIVIIPSAIKMIIFYEFLSFEWFMCACLF